MLFKEALSVGVTPLSRILALFCGKILRIGIVHPNKNDIDELYEHPTQSQ